MRNLSGALLSLVVSAILTLSPALAEPGSPRGRKEPYEWIGAMRMLTREFKGDGGKVLRLGDSITYANPSTAFLRNGTGRTQEQLDICRWMKADVKDKSSGVWLSIYDQPCNRSFTAASGVNSEQYLAGGKGGLPKLDDIVREHNPQIACVLLGTNDLHAGQAPEVFAKNMETIVTTLIANKTIPVLTTLPPTRRNPDLVIRYNEALWKLGNNYKLPIIDFYGEIMSRRPDDWLGTLISDDGVHPSVGESAGPATEENLSRSGYLLFSWVTLNRLVQIKKEVID